MSNEVKFVSDRDAALSKFAPPQFWWERFAFMGPVAGIPLMVIGAMAAYAHYLQGWINASDSAMVFGGLCITVGAPIVAIQQWRKRKRWQQAREQLLGDSAYLVSVLDGLRAIPSRGVGAREARVRLFEYVGAEPLIRPILLEMAAQPPVSPDAAAVEFRTRLERRQSARVGR